MTAVARFAHKDHPMIVGDLLLSGPAVPGRTVSIPTVEDMSAAFSSGSAADVPFGLRRKIAIVADNLIVGWSGAYPLASDVIAELKRLSEHQAFTWPTMQRHLGSLDPSIWSDISIAGFVLDRNGAAQFRFARNFHEQTTTQFSMVVLFGSGMQAVYDRLRQLPPFEPVGVSLNPLEQSANCPSAA
jgi:hypothetical protein